MNNINFILNLFTNGLITILNTNLKGIIKSYKMIYISDDNVSLDTDLVTNMKQTPLVIIDQINIESSTYDHFIISFQKSIIFIKKTSLNILKAYFSKNNKKSELPICFLSDSKNDFDELVFHDENIELKYQELESNSYFNEEITNFNKEIILPASLLPNQKEVCKKVISSISAYLIMKGYLKTKSDRINEFFSSNQKTQPIKVTDLSEFIELRTLGIGLSIAKLFYHIEREELFVIKEGYSKNEKSKLFDREKSNYSQISHPFLPKYFGDFSNYQIIEFINGNTLNDVDKLYDNDKITIIYEIMLVIQYLHEKKFIYRDLKPNNVIFDKNKTAVLIDFDRMIKINSNFNNETHTAGFNSVFMDPRVESSYFSYEIDIFSIGQMIFYLMNKKIPNEINCNQTQNFGNYPKMKDFYERCTNISIYERPQISELIKEFYMSFKTQISIPQDVLEDIEDLSYNLNNTVKIPYYLCENITNYEFIPDKSPTSFLYAHKPQLDDVTSHMILGNLFFQGNRYFQKNIDESISQFTTAALGGNINAQIMLGKIYCDGKDIPRNMEKSIQFFTMAANQNNSTALLNLGIIYFSNEYMQRDINKAINYFQLSSNLNNSDAHFYLGFIYSNDQYVQRDINKSIFYYTLASNMNNGNAQYNLANIYYDGKYVNRDVN